MSLITAALSTGWDIISAEASSQGMSCSCWVAGCRFLFPVPSALHRGPHDPCSSCAKGHAPATGQLAVSFFHEFDMTTSLQCLYLQCSQCRGIGATVNPSHFYAALWRLPCPCDPLACLPRHVISSSTYTHMCNSVLKSSVLGHGWMDGFMACSSFFRFHLFMPALSRSDRARVHARWSVLSRSCLAA